MKHDRPAPDHQQAARLQRELATPRGPVPPCASGCMRHGRHLDPPGVGDLVSSAVCSLACGDDCDRRCKGEVGPDGKRRAHCRGCVPRPAEVLDDGTVLSVCAGCASRARRAIAALPPLVAWIRAQDVPSMAVNDEPMRKQGKKSPPLPFRADAIDTSDELHAALVSWVMLVVEEHPGGFRGPDLTGSVRARRVLADNTGPVIGLAGLGGRMSMGVHPVREYVTRLHPGPGREGPVADLVERYVDRIDAGGWVMEGGARVTPVQATERAARWLDMHLDWALQQPWARDLCAELPAAVATAEHRWPTGERPIRLPTKCPECGRASLVRHAPGWPGADVMITCEASDCGQSIRKDLYDFHARLVLEDNQRSQREAAS